MKSYRYKYDILNMVLCFTLAILMFSCDKLDDNPAEISDVEFSIKSSQIEELTGTKSTEHSYVIVFCAENSVGEQVVSWKRLQLYSFNDEYLSETFVLSVGEYKITSFLLLTTSFEAKFITPMEGSEYEGLVEDPLPIEFIVESDQVTSIAVQVIPTENNPPENFGYASFNVDILDTYQFMIAAFAYDEQENLVNFKGAKINITVDSKLIYSGYLSEETNSILMPADGNKYLISVFQNGYLSHHKYFSNSEILSYSQPHGTPYTVLLMKAKGGLLFWNKLDSKDNVVKSDVGPPILMVNYKFNPWDEAQISEAKFNKGLYINHDIKEGWQNDGGNFFALDIHEIGLNPTRGCIEFWFKYKYDCSTHNHAYFLRSEDRLESHFTEPMILNNTLIAIGWNGWDYGTYGKRYFFAFNSPNGSNHDVLTDSYSVDSGGDLEFNTNTLLHFAFVWDAVGISTTDETMRLYVDDVLVKSSTINISDVEMFNKYLYLGTTPNQKNWDHHYNAVKGVMDNIKIWSYAKSDFSDRFEEY